MINVLNIIISKFIDYLVERPFIKNKHKGKNVDKIIKLYSKVDYTKAFVKFRFWFGPLHEINKITPKKGLILDLGSGEGILANFLAISSTKRKIVGVEISANRVKQARKGLKNTKFINKSIFDVDLPKVDVIIVSHVFHHLGSKVLQEKMIAICHKKLKDNGKLIVAEVDRGINIRYLFGWIVDILLVPIFFEKKLLDLKIYHRSRNEWKNIFIKNGFKVKSMKTTKDRIYPEVIFELVKI